MTALSATLLLAATLTGQTAVQPVAAASSTSPSTAPESSEPRTERFRYGIGYGAAADRNDFSGTVTYDRTTHADGHLTIKEQWRFNLPTIGSMLTNKVRGTLVQAVRLCEVEADGRIRSLSGWGKSGSRQVWSMRFDPRSRTLAVTTPKAFGKSKTTRHRIPAGAIAGPYHDLGLLTVPKWRAGKQTVVAGDLVNTPHLPPLPIGTTTPQFQPAGSRSLFGLTKLSTLEATPKEFGSIFNPQVAQVTAMRHANNSLAYLFFQNEGQGGIKVFFLKPLAR